MTITTVLHGGKKWKCIMSDGSVCYLDRKLAKKRTTKYTTYAVESQTPYLIKNGRVYRIIRWVGFRNKTVVFERPSHAPKGTF